MMVETDPDAFDSPSNAKRKLGDESDSLLGSHSPINEEMPEATLKRQRVIGPIGPIDSNRDAHQTVNEIAAEQTDSSDEDDFGPSLPPQEDKESAQEPEAHPDPYSSGHSLGPSVDDTSDGKMNQRDEWMVLPPDKGSWASNIDPTSLRNRKFTTGRSARSAQWDKTGTGPSWTETPAEKKIRLENEIMGIQAPAENDSQGTSGRPLKNDSTTAEKIRLFNVSVSQAGHLHPYTKAWQ